MADKKEKFKQIRSLKNIKEVDEWLIAGFPAPEVAKRIHDSGGCQDLKRSSLVETIRRYRRTVLPADILATRMPHVIASIHKDFADKLEELKRLEKAYEAQLYRFDLAHARERMDGVLDDTVDKILNNLLKIINSMHEIKMDIGVSGSRELGTVTISTEKVEEMRKKYGDGAANAFADPVRRNRVMAVFNAAKKVVEIEESQNSGLIAEVGLPEDE